MTEGQIRYQQVVENQRHNLAMEKLGEEETRVHKREIKIKEKQEERNAQIFPYQKQTAFWGSVGAEISSLLGSAQFINTGIVATRNLFGLFGDTSKFVSGAQGGYYQGSLFA